MKTLLILRHAKSDWSTDSRLDADRPLARRGEKAARSIGRFIASSSNAPDGAICSPARRAVETLELAMAAGKWSCPVRASPSLYGAGVGGVLAAVGAESDANGVVLVVSHEPDCSTLVSRLVGGGSFDMPTAALARIECDLDQWADIESGVGSLTFLVTPRLIGD